MVFGRTWFYFSPFSKLGRTTRLLVAAPPPGRRQAPGPACGAGEALRLDIAALEEGFFTGGQLANLGIQPGEVLGALPATVAAVLPQVQLT
jgi:methionyl-tRNA formyltransferase